MAGQVTKVLVDDNQRVKKGDLLVQLDKEPYQVQVDIKQAAVVTAKGELARAWPRCSGLAAQARRNRFKLEHAMEDVRIRSPTAEVQRAQLEGREANLMLAEHDYERGEKLVAKGRISKQEFDQYKAALVGRDKPA